ncbi:MAG: hypothetical protein V3R13_04870 [Nitrososphaerales archaeon]
MSERLLSIIRITLQQQKWFRVFEPILITNNVLNPSEFNLSNNEVQKSPSNRPVTGIETKKGISYTRGPQLLQPSVIS